MHTRLFPAAFGSARSSRPPGGRAVFGVALCGLGLGFLTMAVAPMLATAQVVPPLSCTVTACDPGVRGGPLGAGGPIDGLTTQQRAFFDSGLDRFNELDSVSGTIAGQEDGGLGPRFNLNQCAGCHAQPASGGSSP